MFRIRLTGLLTIWMLFSAYDVMALCAWQTPEKAYEHALVVFSGTAVKDQLSDNVVTIKVEKYFKGSGPESINLATASEPNEWREDESVQFQKGKHYIVYVSGHRKRDGKWMASGCSGTKEIPSFNNSLKEIERAAQ